MINRLSRLPLNIAMLLLVLYFSFFAAWYAAYSNYFFFPIVYEVEDIGGHVMKYAPENTKGRADFVYVAQSVHLRIFADMLKAVNDGGKGLEDIGYPAGTGIKKRFLTGEETQHLQDVANLISGIRSFWKLAVILLLAIAGHMIYRRIRPYSLRSMLLIMAGSAGVLWVLLHFFGFVKIFYALHRMIFPEGHKWFFYYNESLMSTMLKAPDSFAVFGGILGVFALAAFILLYWAVSKLMVSLTRFD